MTKLKLLGATALQSVIAVGALSMAQPALAQATSTDVVASAQTTVAPAAEAADDCVANTTADGCQSVVVTGSRIRRPNLESTVPITSVSGEQFFQTGDSQRRRHAQRPAAAPQHLRQQNPSLGIGIAGLNLLDLRGLGTQRTLVLVNGRRHVAADILNNAVSPDVNTIPTDLIERVDIVTGGNSAVYGSDAIAGVVNFVLRRDFEGFQVRGQAGVTEEGFGGNQYVSAMYGKNFADGRGNITLHGEYAHQDRVFASDCPLASANRTASPSSTSTRAAFRTTATASPTGSSCMTSAARDHLFRRLDTNQPAGWFSGSVWRRNACQ